MCELLRNKFSMQIATVNPLPTPIILPGGIPVKRPTADLLALGWVTWKRETRDGKLTKVPKDPKTGYNASSVNPSTWSPYPDAVEACLRRNHAGVGPVLVKGVTVVDLDHCRDKVTGQIQPAALIVAAKINSYTEISQSGEGLHIFVRATLPASGRVNHSRGVEMYDSGRFVAYTGDRLEFLPETVENRQSEIDEYHADVFGKPEPKATTPRTPSAPPSLSDRELVNLATAKWNGKFTPLWAGNWTGYPSQSEADLALTNYNRDISGGDEATMRRLFLQSGLASTLDRKSKPDDYLDRTIAKSLSNWIPNDPRYRPADPSLIVRHGAGEEPTPKMGVTPDSCDTRLVLACLTLMGRVAELERTAKLREVEVKIARNPEVKTVAPAVRVAAFAYSHAVDTGKLQRGEPYKIYLPDLAVTLGKGGLDADGKPDAEAVKAGGAIGAHLKQYALTANLEYKSEPPRDPVTGAVVGPKRSYITFTGADVFDDLGKLAEVRDLPTMTDSTGRQKAKWGGKRYPCPVCGSLNTKHLCLDCGNVFTEADYSQDGGNSPEPDATSVLLSSSVVVPPCEDFGVTPEPDVAEDPTPKMGVASDDLPTCSECPAPATIKRANGKPYCGAHGWWGATEPDVGPRQAYFDAAGGGG